VVEVDRLAGSTQRHLDSLATDRTTTTIELATLVPRGSPSEARYFRMTNNCVVMLCFRGVARLVIGRDTGFLKVVSGWRH